MYSSGVFVFVYLSQEQRTLKSSDNSVEVKGLKENHAYEFSVAASTRVGEGPSTSRVSVTTTNKGDFEMKKTMCT